MGRDKDKVHFEVDDPETRINNILACGSFSKIRTRVIDAVTCDPCKSTLAYKTAASVIDLGPTKQYVEGQHGRREKLPNKVTVEYHTTEVKEGEGTIMAKIDMPVFPTIMVSDGFHAHVFDSSFEGPCDIPLIRRQSYIARLRALATILEEE